MSRSALCMMVVLAGIVGCGGGGDQEIPLSVQSNQPQTTETSAAGTAAPAPAPEPGQHVLVGNWKGGLLATAEQLKAMGCESVASVIDSTHGFEWPHTLSGVSEIPPQFFEYTASTTFPW